MANDWLLRPWWRTQTPWSVPDGQSAPRRRPGIDRPVPPMRHPSSTRPPSRSMGYGHKPRCRGARRAEREQTRSGSSGSKVVGGSCTSPSVTDPATPRGRRCRSVPAQPSREPRQRVRASAKLREFRTRYRLSEPAPLARGTRQIRLTVAESLQFTVASDRSLRSAGCTTSTGAEAPRLLPRPAIVHRAHVLDAPPHIPSLSPHHRLVHGNEPSHALRVGPHPG